MSWLNILVIIFMLAILFSLFRGLFFLGRGDPESSKQLLKSLKWRIALSTLLFLTLMTLDHFDVINLRSQVCEINNLC